LIALSVAFFFEVFVLFFTSLSAVTSLFADLEETTATPIPLPTITTATTQAIIFALSGIIEIFSRIFFIT
jgi:predicted membrane-bound mannosyltransferase